MKLYVDASLAEGATSFGRVSLVPYFRRHQTSKNTRVKKKYVYTSIYLLLNTVDIP